MTDQEIYHESFIHLLYKITNNLRYIFLGFNRDAKKNKLIIHAYYEKLPSEIEKELIDDLGTDIIGTIDWINWEYQIDINITSDHFDQMAKTEYLLYARFEGHGFEDILNKDN